MTTTTDQQVETTPVETREHTVRLLFRVQATDPRDAVEVFISQIVNHGLRDWTYFVEDRDAEAQFFVGGNGTVEAAEFLSDEDENEEDGDDEPDEEE